MNPIMMLIILILIGIIGGLIAYLILEVRKKKKYNTYLLTSCEGTRWGCCPDGITPKYDPEGRNCRAPCIGQKKKTGGDMISKCGEEPKYGFCPDGITPRMGPTDFGCPGE